jgi:putative membrane protein
MFWNGMGVWGWTMMIAFWVVVILVVFWAVRSSETPAWSRQDGAFRILDERLARGEIDTEEYRERRAVLEGRG